MTPETLNVILGATLILVALYLALLPVGVCSKCVHCIQERVAAIEKMREDHTKTGRQPCGCRVCSPRPPKDGSK